MLNLDLEQLEQAAEAAAAPHVPPVAVGDPVITWSLDGTAVYGGPSDDPIWETVEYGAIDGRMTPRIFCAAGDVAPAGTPLADPKDPRVDVRRSKRPFTYLPGDWYLSVPDGKGGSRGSWHKTKKAAVGDAVRRLAIVDWHTARSAA